MGETKKRGPKGKNAFLNFLDGISFVQIFMFWIVMTINFGIVFFLLSSYPEHTVEYRGEAIKPDIVGLQNSVYYSFITVTTTGYGDLSPNGLSKLLAVFEVVFGVIIQGIVVSKLVSFKQEAILEEIYNINFEEAFTNFRRGLSLVRTDIVLTIEKIESGTIKPREIKDLWVIFTGLDQTLTNIKNLAIPTKDNTYNKTLDSSKLELILNSMKLSINKIVELIKTLKSHDIEWRDDLLLSSINFDIQVCREIVEYELKRTTDLKIIEKINNLKTIINELDNQVKQKDEPHPAHSPPSPPPAVKIEVPPEPEPKVEEEKNREPLKFEFTADPENKEINEPNNEEPAAPSDPRKLEMHHAESEKKKDYQTFL